MEHTIIYCPDIECDSCIKVINRGFAKLKGIENTVFKKNFLEVSYDPVKVKPHEIAACIRQLGFRAGFEPFLRKTFKERLRDFRENKEKYEVEYRMIRYSVLNLVLLALVESLIYFLFFREDPAFIGRYGWWIFYLDLAVVSIGAAMWHLNSYRASLTSMVGMMIGMTFGMQTGLMIGLIMGATNGMFVGSMAGMLAGVFVGWHNGKCCGIMGVMEGAMAGVMSGTMGAMIGVMLFIDRILIFMPFFMLINIMVMWGLSYMLFEEVVEDNPKAEKSGIRFVRFFIYCILAVLLLSLIMIYGPKSGFAKVI